MLSLKFEMNDAQAQFMAHPYFHKDQASEPSNSHYEKPPPPAPLKGENPYEKSPFEGGLRGFESNLSAKMRIAGGFLGSNWVREIPNVYLIIIESGGL
jgi:hypothetical protein